MPVAGRPPGQHDTGCRFRSLGPQPAPEDARSKGADHPFYSRYASARVRCPDRVSLLPLAGGTPLLQKNMHKWSAALAMALLLMLFVIPSSVYDRQALALSPPSDVPGSGSRTFPETGKTVRGIFLDYWNTHGGLAQQGYPISAEMQEKSDLNGKTYTVQYFERAVFEMHPENQPPNDVLLSQLGKFYYDSKHTLKVKYPGANASLNGAGATFPLPYISK